MKHKLRHLLFIITLFALGLPVHAQTDSLPDTQVNYSYGGQLDFRLRVPEGQAPNQAQLRFRQIDGSNTEIIDAIVTDTDGGYTLEATQDLTNNIITPFATVDFWWVLSFETSDDIETEPERFEYIDNRFEWQTVSNQPAVEVHWYDGNARFGQTAADIAQDAYARIANILNLPTTPETPIDIYIYATGNDLQAGLRLVGQDWIGGHADPSLNVILVAIPNLQPSQAAIEFGRFLPHELAHVLIYQRTTNNYRSMPRWFDEGLATLYENQPSATYRQVLAAAASNDTLLPLESLCGSFPFGTNDTFLAYAQSESVVRYIVDNWGESAINEMLTLYGEGVSCEVGVQTALGISLAELETQWKAEVLGITPAGAALAPYIPFLIIAGLLVIAGLFMWRPASRQSKINDLVS